MLISAPYAYACTNYERVIFHSSLTHLLCAVNIYFSAHLFTYKFYVWFFLTNFNSTCPWKLSKLSRKRSNQNLPTNQIENPLHKYAVFAFKALHIFSLLTVNTILGNFIYICFIFPSISKPFTAPSNEHLLVTSLRVNERNELKT